MDWPGMTIDPSGYPCFRVKLSREINGEYALPSESAYGFQRVRQPGDPSQFPDCKGTALSQRAIDCGSG
jgi:hypothetical protein